METRIIIKTNDGRYIKSGTDCATEFTKSIFSAKFFKNEDAARHCVAGSRRWLEKYGKAFGGNWPSSFNIVTVKMEEVEYLD